MFTKMEIGRIAGIPIYLDMFFVLILFVFGHRYFTSGDTQLMSAGLIIIAGLMLSILLHELGHAFAGRLFGVATREIELTGLGGVAHFANSLPRSAFARTVIFLAGPAANLVLWLGLEWVAVKAFAIEKPMLALSLATLSLANYWLLVFNLLPAFPLDGGRTLEAWIEALFGNSWAVRVVAVLGLIVTAGVVWMALPTNFWLLFLAFFLFQVNWSALDGARTGPR